MLSFDNFILTTIGPKNYRLCLEFDLDMWSTNHHSVPLAQYGHYWSSVGGLLNEEEISETDGVPHQNGDSTKHRVRKVSNIPLGEGKLCEEDDMAHMVSPLALVSGGLNLSFKKKNCLRHYPYPFFFSCIEHKSKWSSFCMWNKWCSRCANQEDYVSKSQPIQETLGVVIISQPYIIFNPLHDIFLSEDQEQDCKICIRLVKHNLIFPNFIRSVYNYYIS